MDYEKKYKEALEKLKPKMKDINDIIISREDFEEIFPELKESEDEKIRKEIINYFRCQSRDEPSRKTTHEKWIAWLEKQGQTFTKKDVDDAYIKGVCAVKSELEKQGNIDKASYEIAEKEKYDFVNGQFIECRKSFDEFKEYNSYWFEYVGNDTYIGRSDNILNKKFHITPRQLYRLFTQEHYCYYPKENNEFEKQMDKGSQVKLPIFTFDDVLALQCCMETVKKVQEDKDLYEKLKCLHGRVYDAYYLEKQSEQKQDPCEKCDHFTLNCHNFPCIEKETFDQGKSALEAIKEEKVDNANKVEPKFKVGDEIKTANEEPLIITKINEEGYWSEDLFICGFNEACTWDLVEKNSAWSEEDIKAFNRISAILVDASEVKNWWKEYRLIEREEMIMLTEWLKSLKERIKPKWKPSDEQLDTLHDAAMYVDNSMFPHQKGILMKLYKKLKKLNEE